MPERCIGCAARDAYPPEMHACQRCIPTRDVCQRCMPARCCPSPSSPGCDARPKALINPGRKSSWNPFTSCLRIEMSSFLARAPPSLAFRVVQQRLHQHQHRISSPCFKGTRGFTPYNSYPGRAPGVLIEWWSFLTTTFTSPPPIRLLRYQDCS